MDASSIWSPSRDPRELLDAADTVAVYVLDTPTAIPLLPIVEGHFGDVTNPGARELLFRGLIRFLAAPNDSGPARKDFVSVVQREEVSATLRVRALLRLIVIEVFAGDLVKAREWLDQATHAGDAVESMLVRADLAHWVARIRHMIGEVDPTAGYELAERLSLDAQAPTLVFACLLGKLLALPTWHRPIDNADFDHVTAAAATAGVPRTMVMSHLVRIASEMVALKEPNAAADWICSLDVGDLILAPRQLELRIGEILHRRMQSHKALALHTALSEDERAPKSERWFSKLLYLGCTASTDRRRIGLLIEHVRQWQEAGVEIPERIFASEYLIEQSATEEAVRLLRELEKDPGINPRQLTKVRLLVSSSLIGLGRIAEARAAFELISRDSLVDSPENEGSWLGNAAIFARYGGLDELSDNLSLKAVETLRRGNSPSLATAAAINALDLTLDPAVAESIARLTFDSLPELTGGRRLRACYLLSMHYRRAGDHKRAAALLEEALLTANDLGDATMLAIVILTLTAPFIESDRRLARRVFKDVSRLADRGTAPWAILRYLQAQVAPNGARRLAKTIAAARAFEKCGLTWPAASTWADVAAASDDPDAGIKALRRGFRTTLRAVAQCADPRLRALALERMRPVGANLVRRQLSAGDTTAALETTFRLKSADAIRPDPGAVAVDPALATALRSAMEPRAITSSLMSTALRGAPLSTEAREAGRFAELLARNDPRLRDARIRATAVHRRLGSHETAIEYLVLRDERELVRFVVTRDRIDVRRRRWTPELDEAARVVGAVISGRHHGGSPHIWTRMLRALHDALLVPLGVPRPARVWVAPRAALPKSLEFS